MHTVYWRTLFGVIAVFLVAQSAWSGGRSGAADAPSAIDVIDADEIVTVGTRTEGRLINDSPVPVDLLTAEIMSNSGQTEVGRILQSLAPSFNFSSSSISDGTDALRPKPMKGRRPVPPGFSLRH